MQENIEILKCQKEETDYGKIGIEKQEKKDCYKNSIEALIGYMSENEKNPSEKQWNQYAMCQKYLSGKTIGYLSGIGFNSLCRKLRKEINKKKRQVED